jgi:hypothetical protein
LSFVLNKPPVESPTKKTAGFLGSIAMSDTRPPIAAGPIDRALKFLKSMSVNFGGATSGTGEDAAEGDDGLVVGEPGKFAISGVGEREGRVPASVADGAWARALPQQVRKTTAEAIVFTALYFDRTGSFVDSVAKEKRP